MKADNANCTSETDQILAMPGCESTNNCNLPCMYSGFVKSSATDDHNIFYWMYKTEDFDNAPITIWLNGGPGAASEFGNFLENGPL
jgi:hypothetical protein